MLKPEEIRKLTGMICATAESIGSQITPSAAALIASDLQGYDLEAIGLALAEVRRTARGRLLPGEILGALARRDGRPHADEAWAIALNSVDEHVTVLMTEEIGLALSAVRPVIDAGDMVAARRSFLMAYERLVQEARDKARPAKWEISLGSDRSGRVLAIQEATRLGRISKADATLHLQHHAEQPTTPDGHAIAGLLTGKTAAKPTEKIRARFAELRQSIIENKAQREEREHQDKLDERAAFEKRRDEHLRMVEHLSEKERDRVLGGGE
jgi:hypothetical protein